MCEVGELLIELARLGIRIEANGNRLRYSPKLAVTPELLCRLRSHKAELLAYLRPDHSAVDITNDQKKYAKGVLTAIMCRDLEPPPVVVADSQNRYAEQLRDPFWQKKRIEIFIRDGFTCVHCGDTRTTIHVHHMRGYVRDCAPWEYPADQLQTLCEDCHGALHGCAFGSVIYLGGGEWEYDALCPWRGCRSDEITETDNMRTGCDFCVTCGRDIDFYAATIKAARQ